MCHGLSISLTISSQRCGFVNFVDQADAIRAKDDVLNRLGGRIGMPNGRTARIGFGRADTVQRLEERQRKAQHIANETTGVSSTVHMCDAF